MDRQARIVGGVLLLCVGLLAVLVGRSLVGGDDRDQSAVDVGFLQDMIDHHAQAVRMAVLELSNGSSSIPRRFAGDVIASQRYEMGMMDADLEQRHAKHGAPTRRVMTWMGMSVPLRSMPGLATQAQLDELAAAHGVAADELFFRLMIVHHRGGIHMAEFAAENANDGDIRALAARIVRQQQLEIGEMEQAERRLGFSR